MEMKLKTGKVLNLTQDEMQEVKHMMTNSVFEKMSQYFKWMKNKAHTNLEIIVDDDIESEKDVKKSLSRVLKYGSYEDAADFIIEAIEWFLSYHILNSAKFK